MDTQAEDPPTDQTDQEIYKYCSWVTAISFSKDF